jgi:hypothetical protein
MVEAKNHFGLFLPALSSRIRGECDSLERLLVHLAAWLPTRLAAWLRHVHRDAELPNLSGGTFGSQLETKRRTAAPPGEWEALHQIIDECEGRVDTMPHKRAGESKAYQVLAGNTTRFLSSSVAREE